MINQHHIQPDSPLFQAVQLTHIFSDSKTFPDCLPKKDSAELELEFKELLEKFVSDSFNLPEIAGQTDEISQAASMAQHIDRLWPLLRREPDENVPAASTLIALPYPYIVPGGRFREIYYWDSYFTAEGVVLSDQADLLEMMIKNFAYLIEQYGHIPNGNRTYFLSRSQPPFFCLLLQLLEHTQGIDAIMPYLPALEKEYAYWMDRSASNSLNQPMADKKTVRVEADVILNRYYDAKNEPRAESFREDVQLFWQAPDHHRADLYRNLRSAAESGWDFSSRWFGETGDMSSIRTTEIIPVDLNCLLFNMETNLARWLTPQKPSLASMYAQAAVQRQAAIIKYCWNEEQGWFFDYSWSEKTQSKSWSLAGAYPLFCRVATPEQANQAAQQIKTRFLKPGGVVSTLTETSEQWDYPNGWAPLQWVTVQGLLAYQHDELAKEIAQRFVALAEKVYQRTGKMMEKYNVCDLSLDAGGGEYALQDGFGWTNGVVKAFMALLR